MQHSELEYPARLAVACRFGCTHSPNFLVPQQHLPESRCRLRRLVSTWKPHIQVRPRPPFSKRECAQVSVRTHFRFQM